MTGTLSGALHDLQRSVPPPKPPDDGGGTQPVKTSFRDKLLGSEEFLKRPRVDLIAEQLFTIDYEGGDRLKPKCFIKEEYLKELRVPWQEAVIIKLLGKTIGYLTINDRPKGIWKPTGGLDIVDIGHGFYMVRFDVAADREKVIEGGRG